MNKEEFIGKLQMVYVGDRNASKEIISEYDRLNNIINELEEFLNKVVETGLGIEKITCKNILNYLQELKEHKC